MDKLSEHLVNHYTFTAASDVAAFIGSGKISFCCGIGNVTSATQSGFPEPVAAEAPAAEGGDLGESVLELAAAVYEAYLLGGNISSDGRLFESTDQTVTLTYTFEPLASSVPEPPSIALLGIALAGLAFFRRRKLH